MAFTNSPLVNYTKLCNDYSKGRYHAKYNPDGKIKKITIHHMAGNLSIERCGELFATSERQVSSNYGIGTDGRIGMYVEEKNRPWTSSSPANDYQAVTIEVANDKIGGDWHVSDKALASIIKLCVDICKRNGIKKLNYTGDATGNLTMHCYFTATSCPGPYLKSKFQYIADEVNKQLEEKPAKTETYSKITEGSVVSIAKGAKYYNSNKAVPGWVRNLKWIVKEAKGERIVIDKSTDGKYSINSAIHAKYLTNTQPKTLGVGDNVKLTSNAVIYGTKKKFQSWVYKSILYVRDIKGNRVVVSTQKYGDITGAVDKKYLTKI